ncbi:MAG: hypothetical protein II393_01670 [Cytophagales bacterium]|nr:hypothetical protein [Cytophagales bacterium]
MKNEKPKKLQKRKVDVIKSSENLKYLSRSYYYGTLTDYEYVSGTLILKMAVYTSTAYYGNTSIIRVSVPTDLEEEIFDYLVTGDKYFLITAPYKVKASIGYPYRVDLLLNIFKEIF